MEAIHIKLPNKAGKLDEMRQPQVHLLHGMGSKKTTYVIVLEMGAQYASAELAHVGNDKADEHAITWDVGERVPGTMRKAGMRRTSSLVLSTR